MEPDRFWELIEGAGSPAVLHDRLEALGPDELVAFERAWDAASRAAYTWDLWGAAYVLDGGCGDDGFDYFRAYLISRGRRTYELGLADADALATVGLEDGEVWEDWMSPTMAVIHRRTGTYAFADALEPGAEQLGDPLGEEWDEDELDARFPRMTTRYG